MDPISIGGASGPGATSSGIAASPRPLTHSPKIENEQKQSLPVKAEATLERNNEPDRAMRIFRQEALHSLVAQFQSSFRARIQFTTPYTDFAAADHAATDILGVVRNLVEFDAESRSAVLLQVRQQVEQAVSATSSLVGEGDDIAAVNDAARFIGNGLDALENQGPVATSAASITTVDTSTRQRSTIRIQTQEGDKVRFELRQTDSLSATDIAVSDEQGSATLTEVRLSSNSRFVLKVDGDLNEAELEAIQNIFSQAEALADEFFSGDIAAAFDLAAGLEIDTEQLARVSLKFKSTESTRITQTVLQQLTPAPATGPEIEAPAPAFPPALVLPAPIPVPEPVPGANRVPAEPPVVTPTPNPPTTPEPEPIPAPEPNPVDPAKPAPTTGIDSSLEALFGFLEGLASFLGQIAEDFGQARPESSESGKIHLKFSQSFRLEILQAVFQQASPDQTDGSLDLASQLIDTVSTELEHEDGHHNEHEHEHE